TWGRKRHGTGSRAPFSLTVRRFAGAEEGVLEVVDCLDVDVLEAFGLEGHSFQFPGQGADVDGALLLTAFDLAEDDRLLLARVVGEGGREVPGAADGDQAGLEDVADFEAVHLAALGDVEVLPSHDVPHADVSPFRAAQEETFAVPVFVEAEARLGEAQQDVLVQLLEVVAFLLEKALRRRPAVLLAVEEIPVEEALQARLEAAVVLVHLAARLGEV